jgi:hypothetical protein
MASIEGITKHNAFVKNQAYVLENERRRCSKTRDSSQKWKAIRGSGR